MKSLSFIFTISFSVLLGISVSLLAQDADAKKTKSKLYPGLWSLLGNDRVHEEIGATADQKTKLKKLSDQLRTKWQGGKDGDFEFRKKLYTELRKEFDTQLEEMIDAKQKMRIMDIYFQLSPTPYLLTNKRLTENLELSKDQKSKIRELVAGFVKKNARLNKELSNSRKELSIKINETRLETYQQAFEVLTKVQQKRFRANLGKPFEPKS